MRRFRNGIPDMSVGNWFELIREVAVEAARVSAGGTKPSRLKCVYATESIEMARMFRDKYRPGATIYSVEPTMPNYRMHRGDFELITTPTNEPFVDGFSALAVQYWTTDRPALPEILLETPVRVLARVE